MRNACAEAGGSDAPFGKNTIKTAAVTIAVRPLGGRAGSVANQRNRLQVLAQRKGAICVF